MTSPQPPEPPRNQPLPGEPARSAQRPAPQPAERGKGAPGADTGTPAPHGPGVVKRTTSTVKRILLVVIGALVALFAVFNSQNVEVRWIFGDPIQTPLILALAVTFVAGLAIGWLWAKLNNRGNATH